MNKKITLPIVVILLGVILVASSLLYKKAAPKNKSQNQVSNLTSDGKQVAPDFKLKDLNGKEVKLSDYEGKIVILNFWASWCHYCKIEMPDFNKLNKELVKNKKAVLLEINSGEDISTIKTYLSGNKFNMNVLLDSDTSVSELYSVNGLPSTVVIDKDGNVASYITGQTDKATVEDVINKLK